MKSSKNLDWEKLKEEILRQESFVDKYGDTYKETCLDRVSDLTPSGKHRCFGRPARNLDAQGGYKNYLMCYSGTPDEQRDSDWWGTLLEKRKKTRDMNS